MKQIDKIKSYFSSKEALKKELKDLEKQYRAVLEEMQRRQGDTSYFRDKFHEAIANMALLERQIHAKEECIHQIQYNPEDASYHCYKCFKKFED